MLNEFSLDYKRYQMGLPSSSSKRPSPSEIERIAEENGRLLMLVENDSTTSLDQQQLDSRS